MATFRHVLFPVDFSERSTALCPYVKAWVDQFRAKLTLLNVLGMPIDSMGGVDRSFPVVFDFPALEPVVKERLAAFLNLPGAEVAVELGDASVVIAEYAREHGVDLIMMPTHGYGKFRSLLMGSVVSKVLHDADCAVWTAPHAEDPSMRQHLPVRNILVAVDRGAEQAPVLRQAMDLAKELGASLRLVHAVPGAERQLNDTGGEEFGLFLLDAARKDTAKLQAEAGAGLEASVVAGPVGQVVHQVALEHQSDLLIIGRGVMHDTLGRLRTKSYEIIRQSPCPVLSL
jgi:nucleotide-binding universal stress UspA family protein